MRRALRAAAGAAGALQRSAAADGGIGAATAGARAFHAAGADASAIGMAHRTGMSATTVLCVRKGDQARCRERFRVVRVASCRAACARTRAYARRAARARSCHVARSSGRGALTRQHSAAVPTLPRANTPQRNGAQVVMIGDGQVTMGAEVVKPNVKKVRRIGTGVIGGFAGARPVRCCATARARRRHDATRAAAPLARAALPAPAAALPQRHIARVCPRCRAQLRQRVPSASRRSAPAYACAHSNPALSRALTRALRAGATADAFTLFERLENKLEEHPARALPLLPCCPAGLFASHNRG
jgi:hypothetical protein